MPDEFYIALQAIHILVFGLLLLHKQWRITAAFLLISAALYYFAEPHIAQMREEMYLVRATVDLSFGFAILWLGNKGRLIQPLILASFALYHLIAFAAFKLELYSFLRAAYVPGTNALNVLQIIVVMGGVSDVLVRASMVIKSSRRPVVAGLQHSGQIPRMESKER